MDKEPRIIIPVHLPTMDIAVKGMLISVSMLVLGFIFAEPFLNMLDEALR